MQEKYVLFSPIGNSDPWRNDYFGAFLHIIHHYQPEHVYMFATDDFWHGNGVDRGQKLFNWEKYVKEVSPTTKITKLIHKVAEPHNYDGFKEIFHSIIADIEGKHPDATILLNVTSGTPQMGTTLCLEYVTYPDNKKCIQVATPLKASNSGRDYAIVAAQDTEFPIAFENEKHTESRYRSLEIRSFHDAILRGQIKALIQNHDYSAAAMMVQNEKGMRNRKSLLHLLSQMKKDIQQHQVFQSLKKEKYNDEVRKVLFHFILLRMYEKREDIAEVLIRVKSITEYIAEHYIKKKYGYLLKEKDNKIYLELAGNEAFIEDYKEVLSKKNLEFKKEYYLSLPSYLDILSIKEPDASFLKALKEIQKINHIRNQVAHRLDALNLEDNKNQRLKDIRNAVNATEKLLLLQYEEIDREDLNILTKINEEIEELL